MTNSNHPIRLFSGSSSTAFVKKMCKHLHVEIGEAEVITYSEGNTFVKIQEKVRGKDVYIGQSIAVKPNEYFMELLFWIDAFKRASAKSVTAIIPFFSYAKGDKKDEPRVSIRARVCADCLEAAGVDRILTMDLHSPQIQGFFKIPVDHLSAIPILAREIASLELDNLVVVSPDAGFTKNARIYARLLNAPLAVGDKIRRSNDENAEVLEIIGDVKGKTALLVDDFSITCNTLASAAKLIKAHGAKQVLACISHALLSEAGVRKLENSEIERLIVTDTIDNPNVVGRQKIKVVSVSKIFSDAVRTIHYEESLGQLLDNYEMPVKGSRISQE